MIVIYGWCKEGRPIRQVLRAWCYTCQRESGWWVYRETEWVTFFGINTIPFKSDNTLLCERCGDGMPLPKAQARELLAGVTPDMERADFALRIEEYQFAGKNEVQRNFLIATRQGKQSGVLET